MFDKFYFTVCLIGLCVSCLFTGVAMANMVNDARKIRKKRKAMVSDIFATEERQRVLNCTGINYTIDSDFNFVFETRAIYEKALSILVKSLAV